MPSIDQIIIDQLPQLSSAWDEQNAESKDILLNLSEALKAGNWLLDFERIAPLTNKTMICIDGANAKESMQVGDLIATGASVAEAHETSPYLTGNDVPSEGFIRLLPHRTNNDHLMSAVRAAQELILLARTKDADVRIIDGAYLGNVSEVLARVASDDKILARIIEDELAPSGELSAALREVLNPDRKNQGKIIAVVKNDTNTSYVRAFKEKFGISAGLMIDRVIADRILKPGQFLAPRYLDSNPQVIDLVRRRRRSGLLYENEMSIRLMDELVTDNLDQLDLMRSVKADSTNEGILWTTYFKPTAWAEEDKSIRIEFPFYRSGNSGETIRDFARRMVQIIDQDIFPGSIMEPWCQYAVDVEAKKVSGGIKIAKSYLETHADEETFMRMRNYRS